jgi:hypothetical protein
MRARQIRGSKAKRKTLLAKTLPLAKKFPANQQIPPKHRLTKLPENKKPEIKNGSFMAFYR